MWVCLAPTALISFSCAAVVNLVTALTTPPGPTLSCCCFFFGAREDGMSQSLKVLSALPVKRNPFQSPEQREKFTRILR